MLHNNSKINKNVPHKMQVWSMTKIEKNIMIICNYKVFIKFKNKFYHTTIEQVSVILYDSGL